jgi:hypothetical protein
MVPPLLTPSIKTKTPSKSLPTKTKTPSRTVKTQVKPQVKPQVKTKTPSRTKPTTQTRSKDNLRAFHPISILFEGKELVTSASAGTYHATSPFSAASKMASRHASKNEKGSGSLKVTLKEKGSDKLYTYDVERAAGEREVSLTKGGSGAVVQFKFAHHVKSSR